MSLLRGLLFENLGLKLVALLMAVLIYLHAYTDRPASMLVAFPIQITELSDSLTISGPAPASVEAELRGTGKQLLRLRVTEPVVTLSMAGVGPGRYERALGVADLPLPAGVTLERLVSPRTFSVDVARKDERRLPVAARVTGVPAGDALWTGAVGTVPDHVLVIGPREAIAALDSVPLAWVTLAGRRDTVRASVAAAGLPEPCRTEPALVAVVIPLEPSTTRRVALEVEAPRGGEGYRVAPARVTAVVTVPRGAAGSLPELSAYWTSAPPLRDFVGRKVGVRVNGELPPGSRLRVEPDSVVLEQVTP